MNMNNRCSCGYNPCQCHTSCVTPVACIPAPLAHRPSAPTVSVEGLLKLIDAKCDEEICGFMQGEITLLFMLLGLEGHRPTPPASIVTPIVTPPIQAVPTLPTSAIQLVTNMIETLNGDLTNKYASAELLKKEIGSLWSCLYDKQQHHGEWDDNFVIRDLLHPDDNNCLLDGDPSSIPHNTKVIVPVDVGSTVFHTINGKRCLFESLVDNNIEEPSKAGVLSGIWLNYCDVADTLLRLEHLEKMVSLPSGAQTFVTGIPGRAVVTHDGTGRIETLASGESSQIYEFDRVSHVLDIGTYEYLDKAGRTLIISGNASIGYLADVTDTTANGMSMQWGTEVYVDGVLVKPKGDLYVCNRSGNNSGLADNFSFEVLTTGNSMNIEFAYVLSISLTEAGGAATAAVIGDSLHVDMASATLTFTGDKVV